MLETVTMMCKKDALSRQNLLDSAIANILAFRIASWNDVLKTNVLLSNYSNETNFKKRLFMTRM